MGGAISILLAFIVAILLVRRRKSATPKPYPPGPQPRFLIGNALDLPKADSAREYVDWGRKFNSDILHATAFGIHIIVINSRKIADDLLDQRGVIYSDRPVSNITGLVDWETSIGFLSYNDVWRRQRKICHQNLHTDAKQYQPILLERAHDFVRNILERPAQVFDHVSYLTISTPMRMMYGYLPGTIDHQYIRKADESAKMMGNLVEIGGTLINILPFLRHIPSWMPGASGKKKIEKLRRLTHEVKRIPVEYATTSVKQGTMAPSLVTNFLKKGSPEVTPEYAALTDVAWAVCGGAFDTMSSAIKSFLHLMVTHPEIQKKAHEQIDGVIGGSRLPDLNDRPILPYIDAIYRELLRHTPPTALGLPHSIAEDDIYEDYLLPKGAVVFANIWAMTHDDHVYPNPHSFTPERFLNHDGTLNDDSRILTYGFGRRTCVGKTVASSFLWLIIASFLACFDIIKAKDENGNEIEIDHSYTDGIVRHKRRFICSVTPRSDQIRKLIESTLD